MGIELLLGPGGRARGNEVLWVRELISVLALRTGARVERSVCAVSPRSLLTLREKLPHIAPFQAKRPDGRKGSEAMHTMISSGEGGPHLSRETVLHSQPLVSAIIIFLNAEKFIREAIESVFAQTYDNWELLLVDDGSTDASTEIAHRYAEQYAGKVRYLEHEDHQNLGMSASRNLGINNAKGKYIYPDLSGILLDVLFTS
jgi:hypothetical protein